MYTDLFGAVRYRVNLHTHSTASDGRLSPEDVVAHYRAGGYDAIALTDHWTRGKHVKDDALTVIRGAEYNIGGSDSRNGVYHIVGLGLNCEPGVTQDSSAQEIINAIHVVGGLAVLAHPAWSLNTPEEIMALRDLDATEIYNTVSDVHMSRRADSSVLVDMLASKGRIYPLLATDDTHYYDGTDDCISYIMVRAESNSAEDILKAVKSKNFYATQGPEIHLMRDGNAFCVRCTPVKEIIFHSNLVWCRRVFEGEQLTEAHYTPQSAECFIRAEVVGADGRRAWSNIIRI